jgi:hypothetical protein
MTEPYENIRRSLAMGPTPGPWSVRYDYVVQAKSFDEGRLVPIAQPYGVRMDGSDLFANAALIAACDPDTIRELLAERDQLAAAIEADRKRGGEPVALEPRVSRFLSDVVTAAGLLEHGKRDKKLASRIAAESYSLRGLFRIAPQLAEPVKVPSDDLAHEIWAAAQTAPGEGIEDAVERVAAILAEPVKEPSEAEMICAEAYQVVGCLLSDLGLFETEQARKILDNLWAARRVHHDVLPWESAERQEHPQQERRPLTESAIQQIGLDMPLHRLDGVIEFARAIERAHGIGVKND